MIYNHYMSKLYDGKSKLWKYIPYKFLIFHNEQVLSEFTEFLLTIAYHQEKIPYSFTIIQL